MLRIDWFLTLFQAFNGESVLRIAEPISSIAVAGFTWRLAVQTKALAIDTRASTRQAEMLQGEERLRAYMGALRFVLSTMDSVIDNFQFYTEVECGFSFVSVIALSAEIDRRRENALVQQELNDKQYRAVDVFARHYISVGRLIWQMEQEGKWPAAIISPATEYTREQLGDKFRAAKMISEVLTSLNVALDALRSEDLKAKCSAVIGSVDMLKSKWWSEIKQRDNAAQAG